MSLSANSDPTADYILGMNQLAVTAPKEKKCFHVKSVAGVYLHYQIAHIKCAQSDRASNNSHTGLL